MEDAPLMFCPDCLAEHPEPATVCCDCGETLVAELPPESADAGGLVWSVTAPVLRSTNLAEILVAKSLLQAHGIPFEVRNELLQDLMGPRFLGGFNPLSGPMELRVPAEYETDARELLTHESRPPESEPDDE